MKKVNQFLVALALFLVFVTQSCKKEGVVEKGMESSLPQTETAKIAAEITAEDATVNVLSTNDKVEKRKEARTALDTRSSCYTVTRLADGRYQFHSVWGDIKYWLFYNRTTGVSTAVASTIVSPTAGSSVAVTFGATTTTTYNVSACYDRVYYPSCNCYTYSVDCNNDYTYNPNTQRAFKHISSSSNISTNLSYFDNTATNNNPNALVFTTGDWGSSGPYHNKSTGVYYYNSSKWGIFNQDGSSIGTNIKVNVLVVNPSSHAFVHTATAPTSHVTVIDHPSLNNNPNARLMVTQRWEGVYNNNPIGVYYTGNRWAIYNQNFAAMPRNAKFNILVDDEIFTVTASSPTLNYYFFSNYKTDYRPNALVFTTQYWTGVYNAHEVGVWYSGNNWSVFNQSRVNMPVNSKYFMMAF
jgi:hypothetical protein